MKCPRCDHTQIDCKDSRPTMEENAIRRRRVCAACGLRFTTYEKIAERDLAALIPRNPFTLAHDVLDGKETAPWW